MDRKLEITQSIFHILKMVQGGPEVQIDYYPVG